MNFKTTLVLLVLAAIAAVLLLPTWFGLSSPPAPSTASAGLAVLEKELGSGPISRVEIKSGERLVVLERGGDGQWTLPGKWPARQAEAEALIKSVAGLHSRFEPLRPQGDPPDLAPFGLDKPVLTVTVQAGTQTHKLELGEPPASKDDTSFSRPTWARIDDGADVVRLAPGLVAALDRPSDYYQQRRLFQPERIAKQEGSAEKVERLAANALVIEDSRKDGTGPYALTRAGNQWDLTRPVRDRTDPDHLNTLLGALPDIWAEQFVPRPYKDLTEYGLKAPEQTLSVTKPSGDIVTLLIGKLSPTVRERKVPGPAPPPGMPFQPPPLTVKDEYRYAKLRDNDQIFEIKVERLKDIFVAAKELRDARLARFKAEDARRLEVKYAGQDVVLVKDKDTWHLQTATGAEAETSKVTELLDKLSGLEARDADIIDNDNADAKTYGFDDPAKVGSVRVTVEEEKGEGEAKKKTTRVIAYSLGKDDTATKKLYVRTDDWPRTNAVDDSLVSLAKRPALAYRGRRILDFAIGDVEQITVKRPAETVVLRQDMGTWKLPGPTAIDADAGKASTLAGSLGTLEAVAYVNDAPKPEDLDKYGLAKDALSAALSFSAASKKTAQTLLIGKALPDKPAEFYAKLASGPSVFAVKKELRDELDQRALAYRPLELWRVAADEISALRLRPAGQDEYRLARQDGSWHIAGPFEATAQATMVEPMVAGLAAPRAERFEAAATTDLKKYGLDDPHLRVALTAGKPEAKERTLLVGKTTETNADQRYAKLADSDAIFVVGSKLTASLDHGALDLLDRRLLAVDPTTLERVQVQAMTPFTLERKGEAWQVTQSPAPAPFSADALTLHTFLAAWSDLQALNFAAYGPKVDLPKYGLDKPATTLTITVQPPEANGKKPPVQTHTLALGKDVEGSVGQRYARLDNGAGVAVLPTFLTRSVARDYLDFVDHSLLKFDAGMMTGLKRQAGADTLEIAKKDDWHILKPADQKADEKVMQQLADRLRGLRAVRIAAYPAKELKPFGLDAPAAVVTVRVGGDKPMPRVLRIGKPVDAVAGSGDPATTGGRAPDRFVQVEGSRAVAVIDGPLAEQLLAAPIRFRDRAIARFADADKLLLERGPRKATFANIDGTWKLTEPIAASAEQTELDDFINALARLRADEMVAEKPADLKPYGLDKPQTQWHFLSGTKEVLNLQIGARDKIGRCYARLAAGDVVFLLDAATTHRVLAEYRTRTVWATPLDAAQVDGVRFGYAQNPFSLVKLDTLWQVPGKPDLVVNVQTVNDMLDALSRLKVERYVLDKGADPKLYGLEPPILALDVQTRDGKRTLHIGRTEGDSKRYYARIPDKDKSDVFLISEAEGTRIVRAPGGVQREGAEAGAADKTVAPALLPRPAGGYDGEGLRPPVSDERCPHDS